MKKSNVKERFLSSLKVRDEVLAWQARHSNSEVNIGSERLSFGFYNETEAFQLELIFPDLFVDKENSVLEAF